MKQEQVSVLLELCQTGIRLFLIAQVVLLMLWSTASIVPYFSEQLSHLGFWLALEILIIFVGSISIQLDIVSRTEQSVRRTRNMLIFYAILLIIGIAANIAHFVLCIVELIECTSNLCLGNHGFLVALTVMLATIALIEVASFYYVMLYLKYIKIKIK